MVRIVPHRRPDQRRGHRPSIRFHRQASNLQRRQDRSVPHALPSQNARRALDARRSQESQRLYRGSCALKLTAEGGLATAAPTGNAMRGSLTFRERLTERPKPRAIEVLDSLDEEGRARPC
jgi:hypothetical protein